MAEEKAPPTEEITDNDKLMAAISYPIPLLAIIILLVEDMRSRAFQKYHAVQSLVANIAIWVIVVVLSCLLTFILGALTAPLGGFGAICGWFPVLLWFITLYWAYLSYQGQYFDIPVVTDFIKNQGWV
ncbi:MAG: hypothetical protein ACE5LG_01040 [Anaerolineae bacterium]